MQNVNDKFAIYFKKFRLKSEFETLKEFAKALANEGLVYKTSLFSHWQSGKRTPRNRKLLINIIKIFVEKGGISSVAEANLFLESANQGYLTQPEKQIFLKKFTNAPMLLPPEIENFIGREKEIISITDKIRINKKILITGMAGVGKTSLAIRLGYLLKNNYPDGVLWAKVDKTNPLNILAKFFQAYGENIFMVKNLTIRAQMFKNLLTDKHLLIILDNVENEQDLKYLIPPLPNLDVIITARKKTFPSLNTAFKINLQSFSEDESFLFLMKSLGKKKSDPT